MAFRSLRKTLLGSSCTSQRDRERIRCSRPCGQCSEEEECGQRPSAVLAGTNSKFLAASSFQKELTPGAGGPGMWLWAARGQATLSLVIMYQGVFIVLVLSKALPHVGGAPVNVNLSQTLGEPTRSKDLYKWAMIKCRVPLSHTQRRVGSSFGDH